jgi:hypothetical protein
MWLTGQSEILTGGRQKFLPPAGLSIDWKLDADSAGMRVVKSCWIIEIQDTDNSALRSVHESRLFIDRRSNVVVLKR